MRNVPGALLQRMVSNPLCLIIFGFLLVTRGLGAEEPLGFFGASRTCESEESYQRHMSNRWTFPPVLPGGYALGKVSVGVGLSVALTQTEYDGLQGSVLLAIDHEEVFEGLSAYGPFRQTTALYLKPGSGVLWLVVMPETAYRLRESVEVDTEETPPTQSLHEPGLLPLHWKTSRLANSLGWTKGASGFQLLDPAKVLQKEDAIRIAESLR